MLLDINGFLRWVSKSAVWSKKINGYILIKNKEHNHTNGGD